jgi:hypothetical protein
MDLKPFLRYWSLTFAVFVFYFFAMLVAAMDVFDELAEAARKRRAAAKGPVLDPNPMVGKNLAGTLLPGPGQRMDSKREWVAGLAKELVARLGAEQRIRTVVLEDSKGHPLVHFSDGKRVETYRVERALVEAAMTGDTAKVNEVKELLTRHLSADFLGMESIRPPRTTELAREVAPKAGAAPAVPPGAPAAAPEPAAPAAAPAPAAPAAPSGEAQLSREERLAAARAKAEALKKSRGGNPPA